MRKIQAILSAIFSLGIVQAAEVPIQTKAKEFSYGAHPVLQAEIVEMEFRVEKTKTRQHDLSRDRSSIDVLKQDVGIHYKYKPSKYVELNQALRLGVSKRHEISEGYFDEELEDRWQQLQRSELALKSSGNVFKVRIHEQFRQVFYSDHDQPDQFFKYGGQLDFRAHKHVSFHPEWSKEDRLDRNQRESSNERFGGHFKWKAFKTVHFQPEIYRERLTDHRDRVRERTGLGMTVVKRFPKQKL
ncbi:MAG: hypothetical protein AAF558_12450, partial [Verrucomicrobiota bacterium]